MLWLDKAFYCRILLDEEAEALAGDAGLVGAAIDDGRWFGAAFPAIDEEVDEVGIVFLYEAGVGEIFGLIVVRCDRGGHDGIAQCAHNGSGYGVVGYAYAHGLAMLVYAGQLRAYRQYESEGTRQIATHEFEVGVGYLDILAEHAEVGAHDREQGLLRVESLDAAHTFHGAYVERVAPYGIESVGGVYYHTTVAQQLGDALYLAGRGVSGV